MMDEDRMVSKTDNPLLFAGWVNEDECRRAISPTGNIGNLQAAFQWWHCAVRPPKPDGVSDSMWKICLEREDNTLEWAAVHRSLEKSNIYYLPDNIKDVIRDMFLEWLVIK